MLEYHVLQFNVCITFLGKGTYEIRSPPPIGNRVKLLGELIPETLKAVLPDFNVNQFGKDYIAMLNAFCSKVVEDREVNKNRPKKPEDAEPPNQQQPPRPQPSTTIQQSRQNLNRKRKRNGSIVKIVTDAERREKREKRFSELVPL